LCQPNWCRLLPFLSPVSPLLWPTSSCRRTMSHFFPVEQDEFVASASSSNNALSHRLSSQAEIKVLNLHHRRRLLSSDRSTPTLHCYKKIISTLTTLSTNQLCLHFVSSLARAPRHRSSTRRHRSLSLMSHAHHPSAQQDPR
jgi:hypothetical protein